MGTAFGQRCVMGGEIEPERFQVANQASGATLVGYLDRSGLAPECNECVVLAHGYLDSGSGSLMRAISAGLRHGADDSTTGNECFPRPLHAIRFDFAGNGESSGPWSFGGYRAEAADVHTVVTYARRELGLTVRYLVGHSRGATVAAVYAATYGDIPFVAPLAPRFFLSGGGGGAARFSAEQQDALREKGRFEIEHRGRTFVVTREGVEERCALDMEEVVGQIEETVVTVVHGEKDAVIPMADGQALVQRLASRSVSAHFIAIPEADHNFRRHRAQLVDILRAWVLSSGSNGSGASGTPRPGSECQ